MTRGLYTLGDYNKEQILDFMEVVRAARNASNSEEFNEKLILYRRPDAAPEPNEFVKTIPLDEVAHIVPDGLSGDIGYEITKNLSFPQLERIGRDGDIFLKEAIKVNLEIAHGDEPQSQSINEMLDYIQSSPAWQLSL